MADKAAAKNEAAAKRAVAGDTSTADEDVSAGDEVAAKGTSAMDKNYGQGRVRGRQGRGARSRLQWTRAPNRYTSATDKSAAEDAPMADESVASDASAINEAVVKVVAEAASIADENAAKVVTDESVAERSRPRRTWPWPRSRPVREVFSTDEAAA